MSCADCKFINLNAFDVSFGPYVYLSMITLDGKLYVISVASNLCQVCREPINIVLIKVNNTYAIKPHPSLIGTVDTVKLDFQVNNHSFNNYFITSELLGNAIGLQGQYIIYFDKTIKNTEWRERCYSFEDGTTFCVVFKESNIIVITTEGEIIPHYTIPLVKSVTNGRLYENAQFIVRQTKFYNIFDITAKSGKFTKPASIDKIDDF